MKKHTKIPKLKLWTPKARFGLESKALALEILITDKMWDKIISLIDALIIHIFFLAILVLNFNFNIFSSFVPTTESEAKNSLIDESTVLAELERLKREEDFKTTAQRAQEYTLQQKKLEYDYLVSQENANLEGLDKQQQELRQELKELKQRRLSEEAFLKELQREKAKIE